MRIQYINESIQGTSHKVIDKKCQDYNEVRVIDPRIVVAAVADGHGSERCRFSDVGAKLAVIVFCKIIESAWEESHHDYDKMLSDLSDMNGKMKEQIIRIFHRNWKQRVDNAFDKIKLEYEDLRELKETDYELFGTTFLGIVITGEGLFALQIGDGDIAYVNENEASFVIDSPKFLGTETYSLSNDKPWQNAKTYFQKYELDRMIPGLFLISTDGFSNSFLDNEQYFIACKDYFNTIKEYGAKAVQDNLRNWLEQTSAEGCGDDITLVGIYVD